MNDMVLVALRWFGLMILVITAIYVFFTAAKFIIRLLDNYKAKSARPPSKNVAPDISKAVVYSHQQERKYTLFEEGITNILLALLGAVIMGALVFNYVFKG
jgi:hypothetical protein